jgi:quercetin dioxygenase-like cupin family protein
MINIEYFANKVQTERDAVVVPVAPAQLASLINAGRGIMFDLGGPRFELLTSSEEGAYCVMKGTLPAGVSVPLHSHGDAESFHMLSGEAQVLAQTTSGLKWKTLRAGDFAHIPGGVRHAWRNLSTNSAEILCATTPKLGRFLREVGEFVRAGGGDGLLEKLERLSASYGYWMGSPKENAEVGISLQ